MQRVLNLARMLTKISKPKEIISIRSLYLFKKDNQFRKGVHYIVRSYIFEYFILASIIVSSILVKNSRSENAYDMSNPYAVVDLLMNVIFGVEASLKIITYGFVMHSGSYLRDKWNVIDFLILVGGVASDMILMFTDTKKSVSVKVLRLFRVMRPLRLIVRYDSLKVVLDTIIKSFKTLVHVLSFLLLILVIYAIVGIELFKGSFQSYCVSTITSNLSDPITLCRIADPIACSDLPNSTCNEGVLDPSSSVSFDSIGSALLTVLQVITMEDWMFIAYKVESVRSKVVTYSYFISLVFIGGYFAVGLLMGVLGNEFLKSKLQQSRQNLLIKKTIQSAEKNVNMSGGEQHDNLDYAWSPVFFSLITSVRNSIQVNSTVKDRFRLAMKSDWFFWTLFVTCVFDIAFSTAYAHSEKMIITASVFLIVKIAIYILYTAEIVLVVIAFGFKNASKHGTFLFDLLIWLMSSIELIAHACFSTYYIGLSSFRAISLIRVFKYTRFWPQLSLLIKSFFKTMTGTCGLMILLVIVLSIYALLGNQIFANGNASNNFNTFGSSFLMTFVLLTGDGWKGFMDDAMANFNTTFAVIYFISFIIFGNFILINLFLGIIVDTLASEYEENMITADVPDEDSKNLTFRDIERLKKIQKLTGAQKYPTKSLSKKRNHPKTITFSSSNGLSSNTNTNEVCARFGEIAEDVDHQKVEIIKKSTSNDITDLETSDNIISPTVSTSGEKQIRLKSNDSKITISKNYASNNRGSIMSEYEDTKQKANFRRLSVILDHAIAQPIPRHLSLYLFSPHNKFRTGVFSFIASTPCTIFIWFVILSSSLLLAFQDPLKSDANVEKIMQIIDYVFTIVFFIELILKSVAYGFVFGHKNCYLRDPINVIDALVVFSSLLNFVLNQYGLTDFVQLRMLRAIRVVRILKLSSELKEVLNCLFNSVQKILHFLLLYILVNYVYAIIGVQLYKDAIGTCLNGNSTTRLDCESSDSVWEPYKLSFDNVYQATVALFVIGTTDDWFAFLQEILANSSNSRLMAIMFIVSFIILMSFLLLQVLTGFVIVGYQKEKEKDDHYQIFDKMAQECLIAAYSKKPNRSIVDETKWKFRERLFDFVSTTSFQITSLMFIALNTAVLMSQQYNEPVWLIQFQRYANFTFTAIFTIEIGLKFLAVSTHSFIREPWLVFDVLVIFGGWIDIALSELNVASLNTSLFRLFRVARLMKFVGKGGNLRQLFLTLYKSLKSVPSTAIILGLIIYLYAIIGMELFGCMQLDLDPAINKDANFRTFGCSVLLLVRITTMDAWRDVMLACGHPGANTCGASPSSWQSYLSYLYFSSFILICSFWVVNLFLAVIMDNFVYLTHDVSTLKLCHIDRFVKQWHKYDRHGNGYIAADDLIRLLKQLEPPLGKGMFCPARVLYGKLTLLKIPICPNELVKFNEVLLMLVIDALNLNASNEAIRHEIHILLPMIHDETLERILPLQNDPQVRNKKEKHFYENCAAFVITGYFKIYGKVLRIRRSNSIDHDAI